MDVKDQLRIRMEELNIPVSEFARRVGVSPQSVRFWLNGRSFPGKAKTALVERALSFKLDFSHGEAPLGTTVEESLRQIDIETFIDFQRLPPHLKQVISTLTRAILALATSAPDPRDHLRNTPAADLPDSYGYPAQAAPVKRRT